MEPPHDDEPSPRVPARVATVKPKSRTEQGVGLAFAVDRDATLDGTLTAGVLDHLRQGPPESKDGSKPSPRVWYPKAPLRPFTTNVQVAANAVARTNLNQVMANSSGQSVLPTEWTHGHSLPDSPQLNGNMYAEGGWNQDPASLMLTQTAFNRTVEQASTKYGQAAAEALQESYVKATDFLKELVDHAANERYDFRPRDNQEHAEAVDLTWLTSTYYERSCRAMQPMWAVLALSRAPVDTPGRDTNIDRLNQARVEPVRLLMRPADLDPENQTAQHLPQGSLIQLAGMFQPSFVKSLPFGYQHSFIERQIDLATEADALRYMFRMGASGTNTEAPFPPNNPMFAYRIDRVLMTDIQPRSLDQLDQVPVGLRIRIPPAPRGYIRGNVVLRFRSPAKPDPKYVAITQTHAVFVAHIPDTQTWQGGSKANLRVGGSVSDLTASFILYVSQDRKPVLPYHGVMQKRDVNTNTGSMEWQAVYEVSWLEQTSGAAGFLHPVGNKMFLNHLDKVYFCSSRNRTDGVSVEWPRLEVFVELQPQPALARQVRMDHRVWAQRHRPDNETPTEPVPYLLPVESLTLMRDFDIRFDTLPAAMVHLPMVTPRPPGLQPAPQPQPQPPESAVPEGFDFEADEDELWRRIVSKQPPPETVDDEIPPATDAVENGIDLGLESSGSPEEEDEAEQPEAETDVDFT